ncbi:MAG: transcriptional repressor LexA [Candidatus Aminicenantia bacterium]
MRKRQREILEIIRRIFREKGYYPSIREIGKEVGLSSSSSVFKHIIKLEKEGFIKRESGNIRLVDEGIPLIGIIPAGKPIEVFESDEQIEVPSWMLPKGVESFALKVSGKSMIDAYVDDGDIVIVEKTPTANSGEMVVAQLTDGSVTLKKIKIENGKAFLIPQNPQFSTIKAEGVRIIGRVIGVIRKYK